MCLISVSPLNQRMSFLYSKEKGFPGGAVLKNPPANAEDPREAGSIPGSGRSPGEGTGNPLQYSCLEKSLGQRSLEGYSPWGCNELDTTEHARMHAKQRHDQGSRTSP